MKKITEMKRLKFRDKLKKIFPKTKLYFSPPSTLRMTFPCIVYTLSGGASEYADDIRYKYNDSYLVTIIDEDPDSNLYHTMVTNTTFRFNRFYRNDNLNHWVFIAYDD